ncbi:MAG TPA: hypothetical protein VFB43_17820 [Terracidiphilus sp.]|nr:hypothetical protein [Terracidiphilus sp.]
MHSASPLGWFQLWAINMGWPVVTLAAFWLGRYVQKLEMRVAKAESRIELLVDRLMPAVFKALAEIRGLLLGRQR